MEETKLRVNYTAIEQWLDQLEPFLSERYYEIYHYSPLDDKDDLVDPGTRSYYMSLISMLDGCYENDMFSIKELRNYYEAS